MTTSAIRPGTRIDAYDGLRAVALVAILFYHARFSWASGAFVALTVFFTLSGFLITTLLIRAWDPSSGLGLRSFWMRRARRLLPAAWVTLMVVVGMGVLGIWDDAQRRALVVDVPASIAEVVNWVFVFQGRTYGADFTSPSPVEHFWSLAVEEQLYLFVPVALMVLLRLGTRTRDVDGGGGRRFLDHRVAVAGFGALVAASAAASWWWARVDVDGAYFSTVTRSGEVLVGSLLACLLVRQRDPQRIARTTRPVATAVGWIGLLGIVAISAVATTTARWMYPWGFLAVAVATGAIIVASSSAGVLSTILSWPPLVWLGRRSYAVYLLHWPVFLWLTAERVGWAPWPLFALRMTVTIAAAEVLHRCVELPGQRVRVGGRTATPRRAAWSLGVALLAVALVATSWLVGSTAEQASSLERFSSGETTPETAPPAPIKVLLVGDALAASATGWSTIGGSPPVQVNVAAIPDCGLSVGGWVRLGDGTVERDRDRCGDAPAQRDAAIAASGADVVLIWGGLRDVTDRKLSDDEAWIGPGTAAGDEFLRTELGALVDSAGQSGAKVAVLTVPHVRAPQVSLAPAARHLPEGNDERAAMLLQDAAVAAGVPAGGPAENDDARIDRMNELISEVAGSRQVPVIDVAAQMRAWPAGEHDPSLRSGGVGLSVRGAEVLAPWMGEQVRDLRATAGTPVAAPAGGVMGDLTVADPPARPEARDPAGGTPGSCHGHRRLGRVQPDDRAARPSQRSCARRQRTHQAGLPARPRRRSPVPARRRAVRGRLRLGPACGGTARTSAARRGAPLSRRLGGRRPALPWGGAMATRGSTRRRCLRPAGAGRCNRHVRCHRSDGRGGDLCALRSGSDRRVLRASRVGPGPSRPPQRAHRTGGVAASGSSDGPRRRSVAPEPSRWGAGPGDPT